MDDPTPPSRLRRRWKIVSGLLVLVLILVAALPWILGTSLAKPQISRAINQAFSPGKIEFETIELSWFQPTRLSKVVLLDPNDKVVGRTPVAVLSKSLWNLIVPGNAPVVLSLADTALEVERSESGAIDLAEALKTIVSHPDPKRDLTIRIDHGTLNYRDPFLAEPSTADAVDLLLRIPTAPNPVTWSLKLARKESTLEIQGDFDRWLSKGGPPRSPELQVGVVGKSWPFVAKVAEVDAVGKLDGSLDFARKRGQWVWSGDARLNGLRARGKPLREDTLVLDQLEAGWDLREGDEGWAIRRLSLNSSLGSIKAEGQLNGPNGLGKQRIDGNLDLAAIARQLPHALRLREGLSVERGSAKLVVELDSTPEGSTYDIEARVADLLARDHDRKLTLREPATLNGRLIRKGQDSTVERLSLKTSFLDASASGRFEDGVKLEARLDLDGFRRQLGDWVELGSLEMAGKVEISGTYRVQPAGTTDRPEDRVSQKLTLGAPLSGDPAGTLASARYLNRMKATVRGLTVAGFGVGPIRRDLSVLQLAVSGPVDSLGLPEGGHDCFIDLQADETEAHLWLDPQAKSTEFAANLRTPFRSDQKDPQATLRMSGDLSNDRRTLTFLQIGVSSSNIRETILAQGKLDLATGELVIENDPTRPSRAISIGADGVHVSGIGQGLEALRMEGGLTGDAGALDKLISEFSGRSPLGLSGQWSAMAKAQGDSEGVRLASKFGLVEPSISGPKPTRPATMAINAHYSTKLDRLDVSEFAVTTAYGTLDASGKLDEPMGDRRIDLNGKLSPDFEVITALLVDKVEKGAKVAGKPRGFRASGTLGDSSGGWKGLDAEFGFDLQGADIYGMKFGASPVVLRAKNGKLTFDPISTTINDGHIRLEPEIDLDATGGPVLRLAKNSNIREARINDEVSKRVLAYVAPILDQATRASGLVSVDLDHAEFPLGLGRGRQMKVEGAVVFEDVEFAPGPLAGEILGAIGRRDLSLKLDQPVTLTIADGRINQRGMSVPIGDLTRIELTGWVDFDRNLSLVATVPVTSTMLGNNPLLSDIAGGTKVKLPISGTLDNPEIDREAFATNLQDLAKTLLTRGATRGALELLMRLGRPKDPDAPPAPPRTTPEERKAQRQEKKAIRRGEIPDPKAGEPKE
jgi:translocation and assembly module TamB